MQYTADAFAKIWQLQILQNCGNQQIQIHELLKFINSKYVNLTKIFIGFQFSHQIILQVITSISGNFQVTR